MHERRVNKRRESGKIPKSHAVNVLHELEAHIDDGHEAEQRERCYKQRPQLRTGKLHGVFGAVDRILRALRAYHAIYGVVRARGSTPVDVRQHVWSRKCVGRIRQRDSAAEEPIRLVRVSAKSRVGEKHISAFSAAKHTGKKGGVKSIPRVSIVAVVRPRIEKI